ncbi:MAG: heparinase II/III family protein [Candidatus Latescibacterota bacterium]
MRRAAPFWYAYLFAPALAFADTALESFTYREDFETREVRAWAAYPHWEDTAYNENFRVNTMVPGDPNWSIEHKITPYTSVDNYAGAQKLLDMYLLPSSTVRFRYYLKTVQPVEFLKVRFAAGSEGKVDYMIPDPGMNRWIWAEVSFADFVRENPGIAGKDRVKVNALAVLAKIPGADPDMPIFLGLDDITFRGAQAVPLRFVEPLTWKLSEWKPYIARTHYRKGENFTLKGSWALDADRVELAIAPFTHRDSTLYRATLSRSGETWSLPTFALRFPEGFYLGTLSAFRGKEPLSETEFTFIITPDNLSGKHPRVWFDAAGQAEIKAKLRTERFKGVAGGIQSGAKASRERYPLSKITYDIDQFPEENWLASIDGWFDRIVAWRQGVYNNALAYAFFDDREAGEYAKDLLVAISRFPQWVHPWFIKRGQFTYYPVGEAGTEFGIGYDLCYGLMSEEERKIVRDGLFRNLVSGVHRGYVENNSTTNNTSNWVANIASGSILAQAAVYGDDPAAQVEPYFTGALFKEYALIQQGFGRDGGYGEPNGYYYFTMDGISEALPALENVFGIDMSAKIRHSYTELIWAGLVKKKYTFYYGKSGGELRPLTRWAWLLEKYKDPLLGWFYHFMKSGETLEDAIFDTENVPRVDPFKLSPVRAFRDLGTTVFKSGWETDDFVFVMRSGPFYNHQFSDQGSFWLSDRGSLFIERRHGSTEPYLGAALYEPWYIQPISHSTLLIDGNHQSQRTGDCLGFAAGFEDYASIGHFLDGSRAAFSSGDLGRLYWGKVKSMQRNVLYLKPRTLLMLDTVVPAEKDVDVNVLYQTLRLQDITQGSSLSTIAKGGNTLHIKHLSPERPKVAAVETPHYLYTLKGEYPLVKEGMLTVTARTRGNPLVIANLLTSTKEGEKPDITTEQGNGCVLGKANGVTFAYTTRPGFVYSAGEFATDALALTWEGNTVFAAQATEFARLGKTILKSGAPITFELSPKGMKYYRDAAGPVTLGYNEKPKALSINGKAVAGARYDEAKKIVTLDLPAGEGMVGME